MNRIIIIVLGILSVVCNNSLISGQEKPLLAEKVYLHIDREYYNPGEDIWYKAYVIDASSNRLSSVTRNLHVELISPAARILQSRILKITAGIGNGDFHLSDSLPSGTYWIRAYTNYMRNFGDPFYFSKRIFLINPAERSSELHDSLKTLENKISVTFFPEGGSLVENISSLVAFKTTDILGKSCDISGEIFSSNGDPVTSFKSSHLGMGYFNFKPASSLHYYAVITDPGGQEYRTDIPQIFQTGVTIHTIPLKKNSLLVKVFTNTKTLPSVKDSDMTITLSSRNLISKSFIFKISSTVNNFIVPLSEFPDGIIRVTLSGNQEMPLCERLVFKQNNNLVSMVLTSDKQEYKPRELVRFRISLAGDSVVNDKALLSLSAAESGAVNYSANPRSSISSWFLLESDIRGEVEDPASYFDFSNPYRLQELDLLLMTQGWRDFQWKYDSTPYFTNENGFSLSGKARRIIKNEPLKGANINVGLFGDKISAFLSTEPDSSGKFRINGIDITGKGKAIISITDKKKAFRGWLTLDSAVYKPAGVRLLASDNKDSLIKNYSELKQEALTDIVTRKKYKLSDTLRIDDVFVTGKKREQMNFVRMSRSHYVTPDKELIITPDLKNRPDIYTLMAGRLPGVEVTSTGEITVRGGVPLILVDGVPGVDYTLLTPSVLDRIDLLYWSSLYGSQGADGIINFITKRAENDLSLKPLPHSANINIKGFDPPRIFYHPVYNNPDSNSSAPDFRKTIFWEPNVVVKNGQRTTLSCFNADKATTIMVTAEGVTVEGIPVSCRTSYDVKPGK